MDYIPHSDKDFNEWAIIYSSFVDANFAALGLTLAQNTDLQGYLTKWSTDFPAHLTKQNEASAAGQKKDTTRSSFEKTIRELTAIVQANPSVTDAQRKSLGITVPKGTHTPSPTPTTRPVASVDNKQRLQQTVTFYDESTPTSKAKPAGVKGCELWVKIGGTAPIDPSEVTYVATDSKSPYVAHFNGTDGGKIAHWMLRWVNTRGEYGPWSETISVTISA